MPYSVSNLDQASTVLTEYMSVTLADTTTINFPERVILMCRSIFLSRYHVTQSLISYCELFLGWFWLLDDIN